MQRTADEYLRQARGQQDDDALMIQQVEPERIQQQMDAEVDEQEGQRRPLPADIPPMKGSAVQESHQDRRQGEAWEEHPPAEQGHADQVDGCRDQRRAPGSGIGGVDGQRQEAEAEPHKRRLQGEYIGQQDRQSGEYAGQHDLARARESADGGPDRGFRGPPRRRGGGRG